MDGIILKEEKLDFRKMIKHKIRRKFPTFFLSHYCTYSVGPPGLLRNAIVAFLYRSGLAVGKVVIEMGSLVST